MGEKSIFAPWPSFLDVFYGLIDFLTGVLQRTFFAARQSRNKGDYCQHGDDTLPLFHDLHLLILLKANC